MWLFKKILKIMNGRKQKQTGCLETIDWIEGYVTIFWILNVISNIMNHNWVTVHAQWHIQSRRTFTTPIFSLHHFLFAHLFEFLHSNHGIYLYFLIFKWPLQITLFPSVCRCISIYVPSWGTSWDIYRQKLGEAFVIFIF